MDIKELNERKIQLEGENFLVIEEISEIYSIPNTIMKILINEYIKKHILKENIDYYIIPKQLFPVFNITSDKNEEMLVSSKGFIQLSLELIKDSKSKIEQQVKEEKLKIIIDKVYYNTQNNHLQTRLELAKEELKPELPIEPDLELINKTTSWRKQGNKAICSLVRLTDISFEDIRKAIYHNIHLKTGVNFELRLENMKKRAELSGLSKTKIKNLNILDVIALDKTLINMYLNEITNFAKQHNINIKLDYVA